VRRGVVATLLAVACGKAEAPRAAESSAPAAPQASAAAGSACPADGLWAECSVTYRLARAGLAPTTDSSAERSEKGLAGRPMLLKIGLSAHLELYLYADSAARAADAAKLDRASFISGNAPQTIKRERTLIESANLIAFLTSINAHQRERVSDALSAGPPQPTAPATLKPVVSGRP
jgi:hypothetical protein